MKLSKDKISSHEFWTDERCFITECLNSDEVKDFSLAIARVEPSVTHNYTVLGYKRNLYYSKRKWIGHGG
ncbi:MAG: hypothetical protein CM15mP85_29690 [Rhodobacterales bacterium]|nr:MAG: hypothetical protein CM15mP85_29690 [Rhodobacterales bacterium]